MFARATLSCWEYARSRARLGAELKASLPTYGPVRTAKAVVDLVRHPRREILFVIMTKLAVAGYTVTPMLTEWASAPFMEGWFR